jgi:anaerobic selenocysteine-containing dehydrogenase
MANNPAIAPLGEAKPNTEIFRLLAERMGFTEECFRDSDRDIAAVAIEKNWDIDLVLKAGWQRVGPPRTEARYAHGGFATPSGKVEFFSEAAARQGLDPLPTYTGPAEDVRSARARTYPLALISPPARNFLNTTFVNVTSLRATEGEPWVDIHPGDARARGLADGSMARVFNDRGSLLLRTRVTERARPGVVVALSIWWKKLSSDGKNANELTSQDLTDLGGGPLFYDCLVQVEPALVE